MRKTRGFKKNKQGAEWGVVQLIEIMLLIVTIGLVVFGLSTNAFKPLKEKTTQMVYQIMIMLGIGKENSPGAGTRMVDFEGKSYELIVNDDSGKCIVLMDGNSYALDFTPDGGNGQRLKSFEKVWLVNDGRGATGNFYRFRYDVLGYWEFSKTHFQMKEGEWTDWINVKDISFTETVKDLIDALVSADKEQGEALLLDPGRWKTDAYFYTNVDPPKQEWIDIDHEAATNNMLAVREIYDYIVKTCLRTLADTGVYTRVENLDTFSSTFGPTERPCKIDNGYVFLDQSVNGKQYGVPIAEKTGDYGPFVLKYREVNGGWTDYKKDPELVKFGDGSGWEDLKRLLKIKELLQEEC